MDVELGIRVQKLGSEVQDIEFAVSRLARLRFSVLRVCGAGFGVWDSGCRV